MTSLPELRDRFFILEVVRKREGIHSWRHAILRRLVAQLDDFLDHLAFGFMQSALFLPHLDQRLEFFVAHVGAFLQAPRGEAIDDGRADAFEQMPNPIERRHQSPEGEDTERGKR